MDDVRAVMDASGCRCCSPQTVKDLVVGFGLTFDDAGNMS
jgi:hypothetical protein